MISITDKEINQAPGRKVAFTFKGKEYSGVIRDFWGAGHYWVMVDGEEWSVEARNLRYVE